MLILIFIAAQYNSNNKNNDKQEAQVSPKRFISLEILQKSLKVAAFDRSCTTSCWSAILSRLQFYLETFSSYLTCKNVMKRCHSRQIAYCTIVIMTHLTYRFQDISNLVTSATLCATTSLGKASQ